MQAYYSTVEQNLSKFALKKTLEYMSEPGFDGSISKEQIQIVYMILHSPNDILLAYLSYPQFFTFLQVPLTYQSSTSSTSSTSSSTTQTFRRIAKVLHPDKNKHPMANSAFQRFSDAYNSKSQARPNS
jgi:hypothetical protein